MITLVVFGYICLRAALISISHDEAFTYLAHVRSPFGEIFFHPKYLPTNNHLLNTVLIKILTNLLGVSEFILRIPALIGCILYIVMSYKILNLFLKGLNLILGFTLLITHPFLVDFFSCARGYSLGLGFFMTALYFYFKKTRSDNKNGFKNNVLIITALTLAVLSNMAFINIYLPISCMLIFLELRNYSAGDPHALLILFQRFIMRIVIPLSLSCYCLYIIYTPTLLRAMFQISDEAGGKSGFWQDTVGSLIKCTLQEMNYAVPALVFAIKIFIVTILLTSFTSLFYLAFKKRDHPEIKYLCAVNLTLYLMIMFSESEVFLFNAKFAVDRTAIFIVPLFLLLFLLLWSNFQFIFSNITQRVMNTLFLCLMLLMILHNILSANLDSFYNWRYDAATKEVMGIIKQTTQETRHAPGKKYTIGVNWLFVPSTNYYIFVNKIQWMEPTTRKGPDGIYDFYYILDSDKPIIKKYNLRIIKFFDLPKAYLAEP